MLFVLTAIDKENSLPLRMATREAHFAFARGTNVVRLGSLLSVAHVWGAGIAMAYYHNALDIVFWALALALLLATGRGIRWIGSRAAA